MIKSNIISIIFVILLLVLTALLYGITELNEKLKANKCKYDLREVKFEADPIGEDVYLLKFMYGEKVLRSLRFTEADIFNDKDLLYKEFVKWCEEDYGSGD